MNKTVFLIVFTLMSLVALFEQCKPDSRQDIDGYGAEYPRTREAYVVIDSCMELMSEDACKAHHILDSLAESRMISPQRTSYLHAMVLYSAEHDADSALAVCDRLLDEGEFGDDRFIEEEVCVLASSIATSQGRLLLSMRYANRAIPLCHGDERMRGDEATLLLRVGAAQQEMGHTQQALDTYAKALELLQQDNSFSGFIGYLSLKKKQASLFFESGEYDMYIRLCHEVLDVIKSFERDPSIAGQRPKTMQKPGDATRDFADFYEVQIYNSIARAYRMKIESGKSTDAKADADSARLYMERWMLTSNSHSPDNQASALRELYFNGKVEAYHQAKQAVCELYRNDSLLPEYVDYLSLLAMEAADEGNLRASNAYLQRALTVSDSIRRREMLSSLSEQIALNRVQDQELARQDAENQLEFHKIINLLLAAVIVFILVAGIVIVCLMHKNKQSKHIIEMTQQDLTYTQEEIRELTQQLEEQKAERVVANNKALYERIMHAMDVDKIYLNPDLDIKIMAEELCSSRTIISVCINSITGKSFRQWLSEYRLALFVEMFKANPETPIEDLMARCGYQDQSTFRRQFKATYGMTAGEFRKQLAEEE